MANLSLYGTMPGFNAYQQQNVDRRRKQEMEEFDKQRALQADEMQSALFDRGAQEFEFSKQQALQKNEMERMMFERDAEKFNLQKQKLQRGLRLSDLEMKKLERELTQPQSPFKQGTFENRVYQDALMQGHDPMAAERMAYDANFQTKLQTIIDPNTGNRVTVQGQPFFNVQQGGAPVGMGQQQQAPASMNMQEQPTAEAQEAPKTRAQRLDELNQLFGLKREDTSLYDEAHLSTGAISTGARAIGSVVGQANYRFAEEQTKANQRLKTEANKLVKAFQQNPRYAEGERKQVREEIGVLPSLFNSPVQLRAKLEQINDTLLKYAQEDLTLADDPRTNQKDKASYRQSAINAIRFLNAAYAPDDADSGAEQQPRNRRARRQPRQPQQTQQLSNDAELRQLLEIYPP